MAGRPPKEGLDYFELDCHMDEKVDLIEAEFGLKGFAIVIKLYQTIYAGHGYYCEWTPDTSLLWVARHVTPLGGNAGNADGMYPQGDVLVGFPRNIVNNVVSASIRRNIFSKELFVKYHILTSAGIQNRYFRAVTRRGFQNLKKEYLLISVGKNPINVCKNSIIADNNSINVSKNSQSRVREDNTYFTLYELDQAFRDFLNLRSKPVRGRLIETIKNELMVLAHGDEDLALKIVRQSLDNGWSGFYSLDDKSGAKETTRKRSKNKFKNFDERNTDMDALTQEILKKQKPIGG